MLYLTTRNKFDAYTKAHPVKGSRADNGGYYIPFKMPRFTQDELLALKEKSISTTIAEVLNLFFKTELSNWDIEFAIGRYPVRLCPLNQRVTVAELWHNRDCTFASLEATLATKLDPQADRQVTSWVRIAVRIAVLFASWGEMLRCGAVEQRQRFDVAVATGDFTAAMGVWYARQMGLPVGNVICGCNENSAVWELLHLGEIPGDVAVETTTTPEADYAVPEELERLICATLGVDECLRYCAIMERSGRYAPPEGKLEMLREGLYGAVVSQSRLSGLIPSVYRTVGYVMGPYTALAFGGLQDYRAKTGQTAPALLLADKSPVCDSAMVTSAMDITQVQLNKLLEA